MAEYTVGYRDPLEPFDSATVPLPDDTILVVYLNDARLELRHKGEYLEVHHAVRDGTKRLTITPYVSNEIHLRIEH